MTNSVYLSMEATYRAFGILINYAGVEVLIMRDMEIVVEKESQKAFKIRSADVPVTIVNGVSQLNENVIGDMDIVGWEYYGNDREEIILITQSDSRGN